MQATPSVAEGHASTPSGVRTYAVARSSVSHNCRSPSRYPVSRAPHGQRDVGVVRGAQRGRSDGALGVADVGRGPLAPAERQEAGALPVAVLGADGTVDAGDGLPLTLHVRPELVPAGVGEFRREFGRVAGGVGLRAPAGPFLLVVGDHDGHLGPPADVEGVQDPVPLPAFDAVAGAGHLGCEEVEVEPQPVLRGVAAVAAAPAVGPVALEDLPVALQGPARGAGHGEQRPLGALVHVLGGDVERAAVRGGGRGPLDHHVLAVGAASHGHHRRQYRHRHEPSAHSAAPAFRPPATPAPL